MTTEIDSLLPEIYGDLQQLARFHRSRLCSKKNLGTRSIVHQAYLNLVKSKASIKNKAQLLYLTSNAMRNIIIDNARAWAAKKRGGKNIDVPLEQVDLVPAQRSDDLLALEAALIDLNKQNSRLVKVVTCLFFGGLSQEETSEALNLSLSTVKRDWVLAKALLFRKLSS